MYIPTQDEIDLANSRIGKYIQWNNGYRLLVVGKDPNWDYTYTVKDVINGKQWQSVIQNITESKEITKEQAEQNFVTVEIDKPKVAYCPCCNWKVNQSNVSLKLDLKEGRISVNESHRVEDEISTFFIKHNISTRLYYTDNGVELEFISLNRHELTKKQFTKEEKLQLKANRNEFAKQEIIDELRENVIKNEETYTNTLGNREIILSRDKNKKALQWIIESDTHIYYNESGINGAKMLWWEKKDLSKEKLNEVWEDLLVMKERLK